MTRISIAFVTADDPRDKRSWSGTNHFLYKAMEKHIGEVDLLGPYTPQPLKFFCSAFNYLTLRLLNKRFDYRHSFVMRNAYGRHFSALLRRKKYDCVVVCASIASAAGIKTELPVFYINDRVIPGAMNYHKIFTQLFEFSKRQSIATDKEAIVNSRVSVFSSHWAADAAVNLHKVDRAKVKVIPFGANIEERPHFTPEAAFPVEPVRLLFVGVNWFDKGGPVALQCLEALLKQNIDAQLTIVGCHPPEGVRHEKMNVIGFLNKNNPGEFRQLNELFSSSHFFILPTRFEAYGLVFCESAAFGVPALAPATGGIPTIIQDGVTGFLLPEKASGKDYADKIASLVHQPEKWHAMRKAAHQRFEEHLNWDAWAATFRQCLVEQRIIS